MVSLRVISGPLVGEQIEVEQALVIGRQGVDVVIDDPELSRRHLQVRPDGDALIVEDLHSTNGTLVDDLSIEGPVEVRCGSRMTLGMTVIEVVAAVDEDQSESGELTRVRAVPQDTSASPPAQSEPVASAAAQSEPVASAAVVAEPAAAPALVATPYELGVFTPPNPRRARGLASRSWVPVVLSFGSAIATAIALVIYFAQR